MTAAEQHPAAFERRLGATTEASQMLARGPQRRVYEDDFAHLVTPRAEHTVRRWAATGWQTKPLVYTSFNGDHLVDLDLMRYVAHGNGFVPINPDAALGYYLATVALGNAKREVMRDCISLTLACSEFWLFTPERRPERALAEGVVAELLAWRSTHPRGPVRVLPCLLSGGTPTRFKALPRRQRALSPHRLDAVLAAAGRPTLDELSEYWPPDRRRLRGLAYLSYDTGHIKHGDWARACAFADGKVPLAPETLFNRFVSRMVYGGAVAEEMAGDRLAVLSAAHELWVFVTPSSRLLGGDEPLSDQISLDLLAWSHLRPDTPARVLSWGHAGVPKYKAPASWALTTAERRGVSAVDVDAPLLPQRRQRSRWWRATRKRPASPEHAAKTQRA